MNKAVPLPAVSPSNSTLLGRVFRLLSNTTNPIAVQHGIVHLEYPPKVGCGLDG